MKDNLLTITLDQANRTLYLGSLLNPNKYVSNDSYYESVNKLVGALSALTSYPIYYLKAVKS